MENNIIQFEASRRMNLFDEYMKTVNKKEVKDQYVKSTVEKVKERKLKESELMLSRIKSICEDCLVSDSEKVQEIYGYISGYYRGYPEY